MYSPARRLKNQPCHRSGRCRKRSAWALSRANHSAMPGHLVCRETLPVHSAENNRCMSGPGTHGQAAPHKTTCARFRRALFHPASGNAVPAAAGCPAGRAPCRRSHSGRPGSGLLPRRFQASAPPAGCGFPSGHRRPARPRLPGSVHAGWIQRRAGETRTPRTCCSWRCRWY